MVQVLKARFGEQGNQIEKELGTGQEGKIEWGFRRKECCDSLAIFFLMSFLE